MRVATPIGLPSLPLVTAQIQAARGRLDGLARLFVSLDPDKVLARGYVRVSAGGRTLTTKAGAAREQSLVLHFQDGELPVSTGAVPRAPVRSKQPAASDDGPQGKLL